MSRIAIIGAGISGPVAALALAKAGHSVDVYERRHENELRSFGVIGITNENWDALVALGMDAHEYPHNYSEYHGTDDIRTREWIGHYIEWTNLHNALVIAARNAGARFNFGVAYESDYNSGRSIYDWFIVATGVGYAAIRPDTDHNIYTGYVVYRGLSNLTTDYSWLSINDAQKRWSFKLANTDNGAAWELFVHLPKPRPMGTTTIDYVNPNAYTDLPSEFVPFITDSKEMYRAAISDWDIPQSLWINAHTLSIGDANGAMRPQTGMGANLGIDEALNSPWLIENGVDSIGLLLDRKIQHDRGIEIGRRILGV